jgi:hypothetical protein
VRALPSFLRTCTRTRLQRRLCMHMRARNKNKRGASEMLFCVSIASRESRESRETNARGEGKQEDRDGKVGSGARKRYLSVASSLNPFARAPRTVRVLFGAFASRTGDGGCWRCLTRRRRQRNKQRASVRFIGRQKKNEKNEKNEKEKKEQKGRGFICHHYRATDARAT